MKFERYKAGFFGPIADLGTRGFSPSGVFAKVARSAAAVTDSFHAAQMTARKAERYYAMSDAALARIGLTREQIPAELLNELLGRRNDSEAERPKQRVH